MITPIGKNSEGHILYRVTFAEPHQDKVPNVALHFVEGHGTLYWLEEDKSIRCLETKPGDVIDDFDFQSIVHWYLSKTDEGVVFYRTLKDGQVEPEICLQMAP